MIFNRAFLTLIGVGLAAILVCLDYSIVNTCLGAIGADLHTPIARLSWLMSAFGVGFCALMIPLGRWADLVGRRKCLCLSIVIFALSSLAAGYAQHFSTLLFMRILQGISGAALLPASTAIVADAFAEDYRARALGAYGSLLGFGLALGPVVGSFILAHSSWRWIFWLNVPISVISLIICLCVTRESRSSQPTKIDVLGAILLVISLALLILNINLAANVAWLSLPMLLLLTTSILGFILFFKHQARHAAPILPLHLLTKPSVMIGNLNAAATVSPGWVCLFLLPLYLFSMLQMPVLTVGGYLFIMTAMTIIAPIIAGWIFEKISQSIAIYMGFVFSISGLIMMCFLQANGPLWLIVVSFIIFGLGWGAGNGTAIPSAIKGESNTDSAALISGIVLTLLNLVAVVLLSIATTVFSRVEQGQLSKMLIQNGLELSHKQLVKIKSLLTQPHEMIRYLHQLNHTLSTNHIKNLFDTAFMHGLSDAFFVVVLICLTLLTITITVQCRYHRNK